MAVKISVKGNSETNEYQDAIELKEIFETEFRNTSVDGEILIISNATLFGQETKDVDIIALGKLNNYSIRVKTGSKYPKGIDDPSDLQERLMYVNDFCF